MFFINLKWVMKPFIDPFGLGNLISKGPIAPLE